MEKCGGVFHWQLLLVYPAFFCRPDGCATGLEAASLPFLPEIGSSISPCPATRFLPFFGFGRATDLSADTLRLRASIRLTTLRCGSLALPFGVATPACFFLSISTTASS